MGLHRRPCKSRTAPSQRGEGNTLKANAARSLHNPSILHCIILHQRCRRHGRRYYRGHWRMDQHIHCFYMAVPHQACTAIHLMLRDPSTYALHMATPPQQASGSHIANSLRQLCGRGVILPHVHYCRAALALHQTGDYIFAFAPHHPASISSSRRKTRGPTTSAGSAPQGSATECIPLASRCPSCISTLESLESKPARKVERLHCTALTGKRKRMPAFKQRGMAWTLTSQPRRRNGFKHESNLPHCFRAKYVHQPWSTMHAYYLLYFCTLDSQVLGRKEHEVVEAGTTLGDMAVLDQAMLIFFLIAICPLQQSLERCRTMWSRLLPRPMFG